MVNYYEQFKPTADVRAKSYFKIVSDLAKQIPVVEKRLADERLAAENFKSRFAKLEELSIESLSGDVGSFEKYKTSMKKLQNDLEISEEITDNIEKRILPAAKQRLDDATTNLKIVLNQLVLSSRKFADAEINILLKSCIVEHDSFLDAFGKIFQDYGLVFIANDEAQCPGPWPEREIEEMRIRLGMVPNPEPSHQEIWKNYNEQTMAEYAEAVPAEPTPDAGPVDVPQEPIDERNIPEAYILTKENSPARGIPLEDYIAQGGTFPDDEPDAGDAPDAGLDEPEATTIDDPEPGGE